MGRLSYGYTKTHAVFSVVFSVVMSPAAAIMVFVSVEVVERLAIRYIPFSDSRRCRDY